LAAFTLVELLVVISIIALLLGIIVPSYFSIQKKAKVTKAKVTVKNLETAFKAYLDYYRAWPAAFGGGAGTEMLKPVVDILNGGNSDKMVFYEFDTNAVANGALDPWSDPSADESTWRRYRFQVDNYDNKINPAPDGSGTILRSVIVWSDGPDRTNTSDDIKSWD